MPAMLVHVTTRCPGCKAEKVVTVPAAGYERWKDGALIQNALPLLSADDREALISGTCPACWDKMFG